MSAARGQSRAAAGATTQTDAPMQEEAQIVINGIKLTDAESMTVRVAIDTLANVLADGLAQENDGEALANRYLGSLSRIQALLESRETRKQ
jgi:hypothetical protein